MARHETRWVTTQGFNVGWTTTSGKRGAELCVFRIFENPDGPPPRCKFLYASVNGHYPSGEAAKQAAIDGGFLQPFISRSNREFRKRLHKDYVVSDCASCGRTHFHHPVVSVCPRCL